MRSNSVHRLAVEDSATVMMEYANGVRGLVDVRWNSRVFRDQFRVIGTEGEIDLNPLSGPDMRVNGVLEALPPHANVHYPIIENFVDAILDGAPLTCSGDEALWTESVIDAVRAQPAAAAVSNAPDGPRP